MSQKMQVETKALLVVHCPYGDTWVTPAWCQACDGWQGTWYEGDIDNPGNPTAIDCAKAEGVSV